MRSVALLFIVGLLGFFAINAHAQNISNEGTDFWTVFPTHDPSQNDLATMNVNITSRFNSEVTVSCGAYSERKSIPANTVVTFLVDRGQSYIPYENGNTKLTNKGIHIVVTTGMPKVVAYSHVFASARSAATLILPKESLGQKYYSMNYAQDGGGQNFLTLIAVEDNTDLILHKTDGSSLAINFPKAGDVYEFLSTNRDDFTGTFVEVDPTTSPCKRFAAFSGSTSIIISCAGSRDPLLQQLYSVNSWGKNYGITPFMNRNYIYRVVAQDDNTVVRQNGNIIATLNKGKYYESSVLRDATLINADKLISVAQYSLTEACSSAIGSTTQGDPEMVLLNPVEFNIKDVTVFSSSQRAIVEKYVNVFMKTAKTGTFKLNGSTPSVAWIPMTADPKFSYAQITVTDESLTLTADDGFNAIAYGFGRAESYAYSAGTNLYSTSTVTLVNVNSGLKNASAACLSQPTNPSLTVPYRLTQITWNFNDGSQAFVDRNLSSPVVSLDNVGAKLYTYTSPVGKIFNITGKQIITAIAILSPDDTPACFNGADLEFNFEIEVVPLGAANFDIPDICAGTPIKFLDKSVITGNTIAQWKWSFDGVIDTTQNPIKIFTRGSHTVKLSVANSSGCWSDVLSKTFSVNKDFPQLDFTALRPVCLNDNPLQIKVAEKMNLSANPTKTMFKGDGISASGLFDPAKAGVGLHKITYIFSSIAGCTDSVSQDIEVYATTVIEVVPIVYILSGGERMISANVKSANPNYKYNYKWTPSTGLSNDAIINPIASPAQDTKYVLTISIDGLCSVSEEVLVKVLDQVKPFPSFSPNGDGINDVWNIQSLDSYPTSETSVYNRNGQRVFFSRGYTIPFDGNFKNNPLPVGVYYYIIDPKNGRGKVTGPLTIIR